MSETSAFRRFRWTEANRAGDGGRVHREAYRLALWLGLGCSPTGHTEGVCTRCARRGKG